MIQKTGLNRLTGKIALVTGAARTRGMGFATARLFAQEGAEVNLADIDDQVMDRARELQEAGYSATAFTADLTKSDQVNEMVAQITERCGKIDILCNVAGMSVAPRPPFLKMSEEYWDKVLAINVKTTFNCCKAVAPGMVAQKYGKIVNWSSITGTKVVYRYSAAYAASKGAIVALTKALALELGEHNITANAIVPGDIDTRSEVPWKPKDGPRDLSALTPLLRPPISRPGKAEEVARLALFLSADESRFITGTEILIDGGVTIVEPFPGAPSFEG